MIYYSEQLAKVYAGDCRYMTDIDGNSVHCVVTSPPYYGLRRYKGLEDLVWGGREDCQHEWGEDKIVKRGTPGNLSTLVGTQTALLSKEAGNQGAYCQLCGAWRGQLGSEPTIEMFIAHLVEVFREVKRVLRPDGVCWVNIGDSMAGSGSPGGDYRDGKGGDDYLRPYNRNGDGLKPLDACLVPFRLALALQADGWYVREDIIWSKNNPMPESLNGWRFTKHRVTIEEYERLQSLRIAKGDNKNGSQDMPGMSSTKSEGCESTLQWQREGEAGSPRSLSKTESPQTEDKTNCRRDKEEAQSKGKNTVTVSGTQTKTEGISPKVSSNREGQGRNRKKKTLGTLQEVSARLLPYTQRSSIINEKSGEKEKCDSIDGPSIDGSTMARDIESQSLPLSLLQTEGETNDRPRDTSEQGGNSHNGECSTILPEMQFLKEGQNRKTLVDCPGCPKCTPNDGLVLRQGNWRPTNAHEYIFMLTKTDNYYADREAVKEVQTEGTFERYGKGNGKIPHRNKLGGSERSNESFLSATPDAILPGGRNSRSVWQFSTMGYPGAHFATFPPELPLRCIKASTSEVGVCSKCGKPWVRVIDVKMSARHETERADLETDGESAQRGKHSYPTELKTLGWRPSCKCNASVAPAIVLDPFAGSGTTLAVAKSLGHIGIGYELSTEYLPMIKARLQETPEGQLSNQLALI